MTNNSTSNPEQKPADESQTETENRIQNRFPHTWREIWGRILRLGLGETTLRIITGIVATLLVLAVVWVMGKYFLKSQPASAFPLAGTATLQSTILPLAATNAGNTSAVALQSSFGISRIPQIHTNLPSKPRVDVISYVVKEGDTLFGIAAAYGLKPESLLWSNRYILGDNPDNLIPDLKINIPPEDGAIYEWQNGDGLNGVAKFYKVTPQDILNWAGNRLDPNTIGDLSLPNIPSGDHAFHPQRGRRHCGLVTPHHPRHPGRSNQLWRWFLRQDHRRRRWYGHLLLANHAEISVWLRLHLHSSWY